MIVRPDQYVAHVLSLDALHELDAFLAGFLLERRGVIERSSHESVES